MALRPNLPGEPSPLSFPKTQVECYSHFFLVRNAPREIKRILYRIASEFTTFSEVYDKVLRRKKMAPYRTFGFYTESTDEFRFHISLFARFKREVFSENLQRDIEFAEIPMYEAVSVDLPLKESFTLRPEQEEALDFILSPMDDGNPYPLLSMPMGTGKTVTALAAASAIGKRLVIPVLKMYCEKWYFDVFDKLELEEKDVWLVDEGKKLLNLVHAVNDQPENLPKVTIISLNTLGIWYKLYISDPTSPKLAQYPFPPDELFQRMQAGFFISDESHLHLHAIYRLFCFSHIPKSVFLTATMRTYDPTELRIQRMMFPREKRFEKIKMKRYIKAYGIAYNLKDFRTSKIRTTQRGDNKYSHAAFEASILEQPRILKQFLKMIGDIVEEYYHKDYMPGDRAAVFVFTERFADAVCEYLLSRFDYDTRTYLEDDPKENMYESDIRVTTILSGGTAHDVKLLRRVINTVSIDSPKANLQVLGRLRELNDRDVRYYWLYCLNIQKQVEYHEKRKVLIDSWIDTYRDIFFPAIETR